VAVRDSEAVSRTKRAPSLKEVQHKMVILLPLAGVAAAHAIMMRVAAQVEAWAAVEVEGGAPAEPAPMALIPPLETPHLPRAVQAVQALTTV
jgi:hypothetical protein